MERTRVAEVAPPLNTTPTQKNLTVAAVDLGSNSFHMVLARYLDNDIRVLDRLREPVRLAAGLDDRNGLSEEAQVRAVECLRRFGERVRNLPPEQVRAVGTNTLRKASDSMDFRARAEAALGHPIEVISGHEEARLIYQGVSHLHPLVGRRRLVVDIGGGSTEVIVGEEFEPLRVDSLFMGCVTFSRRYFPDGQITRSGFREAQVAAELELRAGKAQMRELGWDAATGASGTINAVSQLLRSNGLGGPEITLAGLKKLRKLLVRAETVDRVELDGLKPDRAPVLPGGLAILIAVFHALKIESMSPAAGALREGVLYDLIGRIEHQDVRDRTVKRFVDRFHVDLQQAARVQHTALRLLQTLPESWGFDLPTARKHLSWASLLHEVGLVVSYPGYHKHGAYLVGHTDLPGFSADDQQLIATLIRGHRRKINWTLFEELPEDQREIAFRLCLILRLAALLNRSRPAERVPTPDVTWSENEIALVLNEKWLAQHPLAMADLTRESEYLTAVHIDLMLRQNVPSGSDSP